MIKNRFKGPVSTRRQSGTSKILQETDLEILSESLCSKLAVTTEAKTNRSHPIDFDREICAAKRQKRPRTRRWKAAKREDEDDGYDFQRLEEEDNGTEKQDYFGGAFRRHVEEI